MSRIEKFPENLLVRLDDFYDIYTPIFHGTEDEREYMHSTSPYIWDNETGRVYCTPKHLYNAFFEQGCADPQDFWEDLASFCINEFAKSLQKIRI